MPILKIVFDIYKTEDKAQFKNFGKAFCSISCSDQQTLKKPRIKLNSNFERENMVLIKYQKSILTLISLN